MDQLRFEADVLGQLERRRNRRNCQNVCTLCLNKNVPTLASCNFDKHRLFLIIYGNQISTFSKMMCLLNTSSPFTFTLVYLLLNISDRNDRVVNGSLVNWSWSQDWSQNLETG